MRSKILITAILLLFAFIFPASARAAVSFTTEFNPDPPTRDKTLTIKVKASEEVFISGTNYVFETKNITSTTNNCILRHSTGQQKGVGMTSITMSNAQELIITIDFGNNKGDACRNKEGVWDLKVYEQNGPVIIESKRFNLESAGGQRPSIAFRSPAQIQRNPDSTKPVIILSNARQGSTYKFWWDGSKVELAQKHTANSDGTVDIEMNRSPSDFFNNTNKSLKLCMTVDQAQDQPAFLSCDYSAIIEVTLGKVAQPKVSCEVNPKNPKTTDTVSIRLDNQKLIQPNYTVTKDGNPFAYSQTLDNKSGSYIANLGRLEQGSYVFNFMDNQDLICQGVFDIKKSSPQDLLDVSCEKNNCTSAAGTLCNNGQGVSTAIGCIPTQIGPLVNTLVSSFIGLAGGIALILMLWGAVEMILSRGDANALKSGQGRFTSAILGLVFILFSIVLLRIIGVDILGLNCITGGVFGGDATASNCRL